MPALDVRIYELGERKQPDVSETAGYGFEEPSGGDNLWRRPSEQGRRYGVRDEATVALDRPSTP